MAGDGGARERKGVREEERGGGGDKEGGQAHGWAGA